MGCQSRIDKGGEVKVADIIDQAELQGLEVQVEQVHVVEGAELGEADEGLELLELEDGVDAEGVGGEEGLEGGGVEVVVEGELLEDAHVEGVDHVEVADVD